MENSKYNNLVIKKEFDELANISNTNDLVDYKYLKLYLIEYLLREGIHTSIMDSRTQHSSKWINFYIKYDVIKPLLKCYLKPLLETVDGEILLDKLLSKLTEAERMELLLNFKNNSYWELHRHEREVEGLYKKYGIDLKQVFIRQPVIIDNKVTERRKNIDLINDFCIVFQDTNPYVLKVYLHELKRRLSIDNKRACEDIRRLITFKLKNKDFTLVLSHDTEGEYNGNNNTITISPRRAGVLTHELSHLMYDHFDVDDKDALKKYEAIRKKINNKQTINKIVAYLKTFHKRFANMQNYFENIYYYEINKKYGNFNEYIKVVCKDIYQSNPDIISVDDNLYFYVDEDNLTDVATELLITEKNEFKNICTSNYYTEELMLENLLDALLKGAIWEGRFDIDCLSGHSGMDFQEYKTLSFDECLADYDTIKNSKKCKRLINDLRALVGDDLILFLDDYLEKNRGFKHGK